MRARAARGGGAGDPAVALKPNGHVQAPRERAGLGSASLERRVEATEEHRARVESQRREIERWRGREARGGHRGRGGQGPDRAGGSERGPNVFPNAKTDHADKTKRLGRRTCVPSGQEASRSVQTTGDTR